MAHLVRYRTPRKVLLPAVVLLLAGILVMLGSEYAGASHPCIFDAGNCRVHWQDFQTNWHWGSNLEDHHDDFKSPSNNARVSTWQNACCPDSPWHTHFDTSAPNHVRTLFFSPTNAPGRAVVFYDGNASFHMNTAQVDFNHNFFDNDSSQSDDAISRSGNPDSDQVDAWSVAAEEWGHVQNIGHFGVAARTMSGVTITGTTTKRNLVAAERTAACEPYRHPQVLDLHNGAGDC